MKKFLLILLIATGSSALAQEQRDLNFLQAHWITYPEWEDSIHPCPVFKKSFITDKTILSATLYITAHGLYEASINNKRVGYDYFTPGFTSYDRRLQYQSYDVTALIKKINEIRVTVGDGWWRGVFGGDLENNRFGNDASILFQLNIVYTGGSKQTIVSDKSWQCGQSNILYSNIYNGEILDANKSTVKWGNARESDFTKDILIPSVSEPVRKQEQFKPVKIFTDSKGERLIDFGQNMSGWVQVKISGHAGDTIKLFHAEALDRDSNFYTGNLREAEAKDIYILKEGEQILEPHFTYHGFRYVLVQGFQPTNENCTAIALYTDLKHTGTFSCSDLMINQLQQNIEWSLNDNFFDIPTDCPQRSERLGWAGDAEIFCRTAAYNRNIKNFFQKWLGDLRADQGVNGAVPIIIPDIYFHLDSIKRGVAGWGDAATIVPWTLYEVYGDPSILKTQYQSMKDWVDYIAHTSKDYLWSARTYGDWYAPGPTTSMPLIDECFFAYSTSLVVKTATVLNQQKDIDFYSALLKNIRNVFTNTFKDSLVTQTACILALQFDLLPDSLKQKTVGHLVELIHQNKDHLATGFLGTPYILDVLSNNGQTELAYKILNQKTIPSWLYPITKGATTIWEKWNAIEPDGTFDTCSLNHYAYGAVGNWLYQHVAGIQSAAPGYKKIIIRPELGGGLTWAKTSYRCSYGNIVSSWKIEDGKTIIDVEIPPGTTAAIYVPVKEGYIIHQVGSGKYHFIGELNNSDGPYVFYSNGKMILHSLNVKGGAVMDSFPEKDKMTRPLQVHFSNHPRWDFSVRLRKQIDNEPCNWEAPVKILALSDIEGEFENFRGLLIANKVMDSLYRWTFGKNHLVICGDLFDRGRDVVAELWLLYKLEDEARVAGGYVHTILGNHDIMNMSGDLRYVQSKYFDNAKQMGLEYIQLYSRDTELGRWLRSKNLIERIGDGLYLHGGISPEIFSEQMDLNTINTECRPFYDEGKHPESFKDKSLLPFFGRNALFWYRGYFMDPRASHSFIDSTLVFYHCRRIVVGHTITDSNIASYYQGKVIGIDVDEHEGHSEGILIDKGIIYIIDQAGKKILIGEGPENPVVQ